MKKLHLIQVGVGGWGWSWAEIVKHSKDWEAVAYVDVSKDNLTKAANFYNMSENNCYNDFDEALKKVEADAVLCVTPPEFHADITIRALESGLNVLVEKPIADTLDKAKMMVKAAEKYGLKLMVSQQYRFKRGPRTVRKIVRERIAGTPSYIIINFHKSPTFPANSFRYRMPYPLLMDMSIHHIDTLRSILDKEPVSVYAETWNTEWSSFKGDPVAFLSLKMEDNVRAIYIGSWVSQKWETTWDGDWRIVCNEGEIHWSGNKIFVKAPIFYTVYTRGMLERDGVLEAELIPMDLEERDYSLHEFAESIRQDRVPETSGDDNLKTFATVLASIDSAREKKEMFIKDYL